MISIYKTTRIIKIILNKFQINFLLIIFLQLD